MIIDTHCHLNHERLSEDIPGCIERARQVGVDQLVVVGFDMRSSQAAQSVAAAYPGTVWAAVGVHPHDAASWDDASRHSVMGLVADPTVVAIGEIGLDYHYDFSPRAVQKAVFEDQLIIANSAGLPVVIHCREAYADTLDVLAEWAPGACGGVMHCWAGTVAEAERTLSIGFMLGFGGTVTFKNADQVRECVRICPDDRLLLETDAPYLAPMPHRGKRNEPAYARFVAERIAEVRRQTVSHVEAITTANARRLFSRICSPTRPSDCHQ